VNPMSFDVTIPSLGESVTEATIGRWLKDDGDLVAADEAILELESDKANMDLAAEQAGVLHILKPAGETVTAGDVVARIEPAAAGAKAGAGARSAGAKAEPPLVRKRRSPPGQRRRHRSRRAKQRSPRRSARRARSARRWSARSALRSGGSPKRRTSICAARAAADREDGSRKPMRSGSPRRRPTAPP